MGLDFWQLQLENIEMYPGSQSTAHPSHIVGTDSNVITRALRSQSFSRPQSRLIVGRIMAVRMKTFIANPLLLQYCTRIEIQFFCAKSLALRMYGSFAHQFMLMTWRFQ
jgi:hypothetical protein